MLDALRSAQDGIAVDKAYAAKRGFQYHDVGGPLGYEAIDVEVFECLASHPDMDSAWRALAKVFDDSKTHPDTKAFAQFCGQVRKTWNSSPKRTAAEHKAHFLKIADEFETAVLQIMREPEFGAMGQVLANVSPAKMMREDQIEWLIDEIRASPEDDEFIKAGDGSAYVRFCLTQAVPTLYQQSLWISEQAKLIAERPSISERPHRDSAERTYFVRHLSNWFDKHHGGRMHEVVACVASALFNDATTADNVRKLVGKDSEVSPLYPGRKVPFNG